MVDFKIIDRLWEEPCVYGEVRSVDNIRDFQTWLKLNCKHLEM